MKAIELFSGAGGLGMGVSLAGFSSVAVVEWDKWACDTIRENQARGYPLVNDWRLFEGDVRDWIRAFDSGAVAGQIDLVAGGPPCQPFSMGGKHKAHNDRRDMFPAAVEVVRRCQPRAFIVENVKGLTRSSFANYYQYILLQFEFPEIVRKADESWREHYTRLQTVKTSTRELGAKGLRYNVVPTLVNSANYGIPQRRERVFIIGFRSDLNVRWSFPSETHALDALLTEQWVTGEYWDRHEISSRRKPSLSPGLAQKVERLRGLRLPPTRLPWRTVRDALVGLSEPNADREHSLIANHRFQDGARAYPGHTGSPLDMPAKTLKAGDHGVPGGENMMVRDNGTLRYFTVRESARLQTFPDSFILHGSWTEAMRQLGNAVPVALAHLVAASVAEKIIEARVSNLASLKAGLVTR